MTSFTAQYFFISNGLGGPRPAIQTATLTDTDLIRGNDADERVTNEGGGSIFNGFTAFVQTGYSLSSVQRVTLEGESRTTVTFDDGSSLAGVNALRDFAAGSYGSSYSWFLLDQDALASVGKTIMDVESVRVTANIDHDLSWADLGFTATIEAPEVPEPPAPEPPAPEPPAPEVPSTIVIEGTNGNDRLVGTDADEILIGGNGNDKLFGRDGADTFVFGADASDGDRDRDVIRDFDMNEDIILLEDGAEIRRIAERDDRVVIWLEGDRDVIVVRDADASIVDNIVFENDAIA